MFTYLSNPIRNELWNNLVVQILIHGKEYKLRPLEIEFLKNMFGISFNSVKLSDVYYKILNFLRIKYSNIEIKLQKEYELNEPKYIFTLKPQGYFSELVLEDLIVDCNKLQNSINSDLYNLCVKHFELEDDDFDLNFISNLKSKSNFLRIHNNIYIEKVNKELENNKKNQLQDILLKVKIHQKGSPYFKN
jgi:hypothetical protein